MKNKKISFDTIEHTSSALEELCKVSNIDTAKKVFGKQYNKILEELLYLIINDKKELLDYSFKLNTLEMEPIAKKLNYVFEKGLNKIGYSGFNVNYNNNEQVKMAIYGYTVAHVYRYLKN